MDGLANTVHECSICLEDCPPGSGGRFAIPNNPETFMCRSCADLEIIPKFHEALKREHNDPVKRANEPIDVNTFADILGQAFMNDFRGKEFEYKTPPARRVYCPADSIAEEGKCNGFIGSRETGYQRCNQCAVSVCTACERVVNTAGLHVCSGRPNKPEDEAFKGLERGVEWQECPQCGRKAERTAGCNEMTCACEAHFCFLCGKLVPWLEQFTHWTQADGGCQRYGDRLHDPPAGVTRFDDDDDDDLSADDNLPEQFTDDEAVEWINNEVFPQQQHPDLGVLFAAAATRLSTPDGDNDFGGVQVEQDPEDLAANGPGIGAMSRVFDAVHRRGDPDLPPGSQEDLLEILSHLRCDRATLTEYAAEEMMRLVILQVQRGQLLDDEAAHNVLNIGDLTHGLLQLVNTILIAYTDDENIDFDDLAASLRLAEQQVRYWAESVLPDTLPPNIANIQYVRTGEVADILSFIVRQQAFNRHDAVEPAVAGENGGETPEVEMTGMDDSPAQSEESASTAPHHLPSVNGSGETTQS